MKISFQKFAEDYRPGETFVKVNGQLGAVRGHSDDGQLVHVLFMDGNSGWYNADKIQRIHNTQPSDESLFGRYGAMDESAVNETSRSYYGFSIDDRVEVKNNDNFFDGGGLGTVVGFSNAGWPDVLLDDHKDFGPIAYLPSRVRKVQQVEDEYGFEKGNDGETTTEPWAGEDDPRNPYNDSVQTEGKVYVKIVGPIDRGDPERVGELGEVISFSDKIDASLVEFMDGEKGWYSSNSLYRIPPLPKGHKWFHEDVDSTKEKKCPKCKGKGHIVHRNSMFPHTARKIKCPKCKGAKVIKEAVDLELFSDWLTVVGNILAHKFGKELDQRSNMERLLRFHKNGWTPPQVAQVIGTQRPDNFIACAGVEQNEEPLVESEQLEKWFYSVKALFDTGVPSHGLKGMMEEGLIDKGELRRSYKLGLSPDQTFRHLMADLHSMDENKEGDFKTVTESFLIGVETSQPGYWYTFGEQGPVFEYRANHKHKVIALPPMNLAGKLMEQKEVDGKWFVRLENKVPQEWLHKYGLIETEVVKENMKWIDLEAEKLISKHNISFHSLADWMQDKAYDFNVDPKFMEAALWNVKNFNHLAYAIMAEDLYQGTFEELLQDYIRANKGRNYKRSIAHDKFMNESQGPPVWVVTAPSGVHMGVCFLGRGPTKEAALEDAYGPRESWGNNTRRSMRTADVYPTTAEDAERLEHGAYD